jgi:hypothetical protein
MKNFFKKEIGKKMDSSCCGVEIKEVVETEEKDDSCCQSSENQEDSCC